ncbi:uncharacterized protein [Spinacia oleracea]|uniref:Uncharacterized protein n=1 Tax=Spinacia oleracea TaxID=3562 RepID=A0ABM3R8C9_SPIOL|nr:uncharacterized protein LOC130467390 [Spinacia oleracea]
MKCPAENRDPKMYCQFHEDIGYDTKDCRSLKRALGGLASKGNLKNYLQRNTHGAGKSYYKKNKSPVSAGEGNHTEGGFVAVISGGPASGGPTMRGQKDYARRLGHVMISGKSPMDPFPMIEIRESDGGRLATPHDDPLVIEIKISNMSNMRVKLKTLQRNAVTNNKTSSGIRVKGIKNKNTMQGDTGKILWKTKSIKSTM